MAIELCDIKADRFMRAFLFAFLAISLLFCGDLALAEPAKAKPAPAALVVTAPVEQGEIRPPLTLVGTTEPRYTAEVACEVDGLVERLAARKGDRVRKGDLLAKQRTLPLKLRLQESRAQFREVLARIEKAEADVRRAERLFDQKFISEEQLQERRTDLDALRQQERRLRASIRIVEDSLARMEIRAPFDGSVVAERTEVGQWLDAGEPVVVLTDLSLIHIMVPVPEQQIGRITQGGSVAVTIDAFPGWALSGTIAAIVPRADTGSRSFPVQVNVDNADGAIMAGMLARVTFHPVTLPSALIVPKDALVPQPEGGGYLVKVSDGTASWVQVKVLASYGDRYAVDPLNKDLAAGDRVVVRGNERVRPGQNVREEAPTP
jgi:RND family efflux transporter MFP subunit